MKIMNYLKGNPDKVKKVARDVLIVICGITFLFSAYKVVTAYLEYEKGGTTYSEIRFDVVTENEITEDTTDSLSNDAEEPFEPEKILEDPKEEAPILVDFDELLEINPDVVGWIYSPDTPINYPVAQGKDNKEYLRHSLRGKYNIAGTIFLDYRNNADFTTGFNVLYGHNLYTQEMFGSLLNYKKEGYYEEHPVMWLLTPQGDYKLHVIGGCTLKANSELYNISISDENFGTVLLNTLDDSDFTTQVDRSQYDNYLVLSTCSYEYDNARYVLVTCMEPLF